MKKLFVVLASVMVLASCMKDNAECSAVNVKAPATEVDALRTYLEDNNITATEDARGFFYMISNAGSGNKPTPCNAITVNYQGRLTNGTVFDQANNVGFYLSSLILGWQEGIPLIAPGGSITLYIPPSLGYGNQTAGTIPPNSNLIFTIDLIAVN